MFKFLCHIENKVLFNVSNLFLCQEEIYINSSFMNFCIDEFQFERKEIISMIEIFTYLREKSFY